MNSPCNEESIIEPQAVGPKKPYSRPLLTAQGDVRDITLAPSPGTFESGYGIGFRTPKDSRGRSRQRSGDTTP